MFQMSKNLKKWSFCKFPGGHSYPYLNPLKHWVSLFAMTLHMVSTFMLHWLLNRKDNVAKFLLGFLAILLTETYSLVGFFENHFVA